MIVLKCINGSFAGMRLHGVPFERKVLHIHGVEAEGVFPVFQGLKVELLADVDTLYYQLGNTDQAFYWGTMREATKILKDVLHRNLSERSLGVHQLIHIGRTLHVQLCLLVLQLLNHLRSIHLVKRLLKSNPLVLHDEDH